MTGEIADEQPFWRVVTELKLSVNDVNTWSLDDIYKVCSFLDMKNDYESAMSAYEEKSMKDNQ